MTFPPLTIDRRSTENHRKTALYQLYQQILERQPYAHERHELAKLEQEFLRDRIGVKRFVKELGKSSIYLNSFYHSASNMKFLELCFKHFLGRAPASRDELQVYGNVLMHKGPGELVSVIVDSEEYRKAFGGFTVPYPRCDYQYESPKAYLESHMLNHEHLGRRGLALPTLYWRDLGLECEAGVCQLPSSPQLDGDAQMPLTNDDEFARVLRLLESAQSNRTVGLTREQTNALRRSLVGHPADTQH